MELQTSRCEAGARSLGHGGIHSILPLFALRHDTDVLANWGCSRLTLNVSILSLIIASSINLFQRLVRYYPSRGFVMVLQKLASA